MSDGRGAGLDCPACGYALTGQVRHRSALASTRDRPITCPECGEVTTLFRLAERALHLRQRQRRAARDATIVLIASAILLMVLPGLKLGGVSGFAIDLTGNLTVVRQLGWIGLDLLLLYAIVIRYTATLLPLERLLAIVGLVITLIILPPLATVGGIVGFIGVEAWRVSPWARESSSAS